MKFKVEIHWTSTTVFVQAKSREEAEKIAIQKASPEANYTIITEVPE